MKDYTAHCYNREFDVYESVYVLAANRDRARDMINELYPDWDIQAIYEEGQW